MQKLRQQSQGGKDPMKWAAHKRRRSSFPRSPTDVHLAEQRSRPFSDTMAMLMKPPAQVAPSGNVVSPAVAGQAKEVQTRPPEK